MNVVTTSRAFALQFIRVPLKSLIFYTGTSFGFWLEEVSSISGTTLASVRIFAAFTAILDSTTLVTKPVVRRQEVARLASLALVVSALQTTIVSRTLYTVLSSCSIRKPSSIPKGIAFFALCATSVL